jgi:hypothetical protein
MMVTDTETLRLLVRDRHARITAERERARRRRRFRRDGRSSA